jgi:hypothetical protein
MMLPIDTLIAMDKVARVEVTYQKKTVMLQVWVYDSYGGDTLTEFQDFKRVDVLEHVVMRLAAKVAEQLKPLRKVKP